MFGNPDIMLFGLMNSMKSGYIVVDMVIVLILPVVFHKVFNWVNQIIPQFFELVEKYRRKDYVRVIRQTIDNKNPWATDKTQHKNNMLQRAIRLYIGMELEGAFDNGTIKLMAVKKDVSRCDDDDAEGAGGGGSMTPAEQLEKKFKALHGPAADDYVELNDELFFKETTADETEENENQDDGGRGRRSRPPNQIHSFMLKCDHVSRGTEVVDKFVRKAYDWYVTKMEAEEDRRRFMYQPLVEKNEDENAKRFYRRYPLSDEKSFDCMFFPERTRVISILDNFLEKKGKYSIEGFPHKLGLLLHGPPGTGKTSLVKAVAQYTKRHIIAVPLSRVKTNQELRDIMFDQEFNYSKKEEENTQNKLKFEEVIFLLEDVDAASDIVLTRDKNGHGHGYARKSTAIQRSESHVFDAANGEGDDDHPRRGSRQSSTAFTPSRSKAKGMKFGETATTESKADAQEDKAKDEKKEESTTEEKKEEGSKESAPAAGEEAAADADAKKETDGGGESKKKKKTKWDKKNAADKLDLAGLLNVLDGVVDTPGRILVMTTNHPEKLDPALLRPGRVNVKLLMGLMDHERCAEMIAHYCKPSAEDTARIDTILAQLFSRGFTISPAEMEQMCAESASVNELIGRLEKKL